MFFTFAILVGIFSYIIFSLGLLRLLYIPILQGISILAIFVFLWLFRKNIVNFFKSFIIKHSIYFYIIFGLIILQISINLVGAIGPELSFDALWYHLTLPKLYIMYHKIWFIPGGLLYYSTMPKLAEMLYTAGLSFGTEVIPKLIHFTFGIFCCLALYTFARKFYGKTLSLLVVAIFYSNLVVGWESITAYIDLIRTFFEILAVWAWVNWQNKKQNKYFFISSIILGFAITTKLLSFETLCIITICNIALFIKEKNAIKSSITYVFIYIFLSLLIPLPWFIFSFVYTQNPFYPFFSPYFTSVQHTIINPVHLSGLTILQTYWSLFTHAADPIGPIYLASIPLLIITFKKLTKPFKLLGVFVVLGLLGWYPVSSIEGSRLLLPYLAIFSLIVPALFTALIKMKIRHSKFMIYTTYCFILLSLIISIFYRLLANIKFIPVVFGKETKSQFLTEHLNFSFGDFYDTDNYFSQHIKSTDTVLLLGFHNEYYVNFPFIDVSWLTSHDKYDYIAIQHGMLTKKASTRKLIYINPTTDVRLYTLKQTN